MSKLTPHIVAPDSSTEVPEYLYGVHPASPKSIETVLQADPDSEDGRSNWVWVRMWNGDLVLGVFPQGETYFACEVDAQWPTEFGS